MHHARNGFLTAKGLEEAAQREHRRTVSLEMGLRRGDLSSILDKVRSVSGLELERNCYVSDEQIDQQYQRFLNGS